MKPISILLAILCIVILFACSKNNNNYSTTDHTIGMGGVRTWTGYANGNALGTKLEGTNLFSWPYPFSYTTTDTSFAIGGVNGYQINVLGTVLTWRSTDSTTKIVRFDSTYSGGSANSFLVWDFGQDTMHFEFHRNYGYNDTTMQYYQTNKYLHSPG